jgi:C-terminal processing protease CtpA/Prc
LLANSFWIDIQRLKFRGRDVPQYLYDTYQELVATRQQVIDTHEPELLIQSIGQAEIDLANAFAQPIYILIDRDCGSSCELLVEALERLPKVQTVGEATSGTVQFGNRGSLYLPNSHIVVGIPIQGAKYFDGRKVEKIGYSPRWPVDSGSDALDFTLDRFFK